MLVTLKNDFHNTEVTVRVLRRSTHLTKYQMRRVNNALCGMADCCCGGIRGPQDVEYTSATLVDKDGYAFESYVID